MSFLRLIATSLGRWPIALAACALLAAAVVLPQLDGPGLVEPQERQLADRVAPPIVPNAKPTDTPASKPASEPVTKDCARQAPPDARARTLSTRAITWGRDHLGDSDTGRKLPLALLGVLTVLAAAGTTMRLAGARAGVIAAIALLAMPLLTLQARALTSEIGTACGASLIVYGLVALGTLGRGWRVVADAILALAAIAAGALLGFYGGGALLGIAVPLGAIALAGGFGAILVRDRSIGANPVAPQKPAGGSLSAGIVALIAGLALIAVLVVIARQTFSFPAVYPGITPPPARELFGRALLPTNCYAWALGGTWRPEDDLRYIYDSTFEQIAYGTFPWGFLAPVAMAALLGAASPERRRLGAVTLAWTAAAWVAGEVFQRKVGFTVFAGFPAMAIALGAWLDDALARRARGEDAASGDEAGPRLIGLLAVLGAVDLGKDMQSFAERLTSLFVGSDAIPYPAQSRLALLPTKAWIVILGGLIALGFAIALATWRPGDRARHRLAAGAAAASLGLTVLLAAFWSALWQPALGAHLSSKAMLDTYQELAKPGEALVVFGDLGQAPLAYTGRAPQTAADRSQVITALARPERVFAIAPQSELCALHREVAGKPYFVIDDRNTRSLLISNRVDGTTDKNPLRSAILHEEPAGIRYRPKTKIVWDNKIQLLGWDLPERASRGASFEVTLYYKILQPVGGAWKSFMHFDGPAGRAGNGDHEPIKGRCPTSTWQLGDYIVDRFTARAGGGGFPGGRYEVWIGFFTGQAPSWRNMTISEAPGDLRDSADRVKLTTLTLD